MNKLLAVLLLLSVVSFSTDFSSCAQTLSSGQYTLTTDLSCTGTGFTIGGNDVTVDLQGHTISGDLGATDYGIVVGAYSNVVIANGTIARFARGLSTANTTVNLDVNNMTFRWGADAVNVRLYGGTGSIRNCTIFNNTASYGLALSIEDAGPPGNWNITNNIIHMSKGGIWIEGNDVANVTGNVLYNLSSYGIFLDAQYPSASNQFNDNLIYNTTMYLYNPDFLSNAQYFNGTTIGSGLTGLVNFSSFALARHNLTEGVNVKITTTLASMNLTALPELNTTATIKFTTDSGCLNATVGFLTGFQTSLELVKALGTAVGNATCNNGTAYYNVSQFSAYAISDEDFGGVWVLPMSEAPLAGLSGIGVIMNVTFYDESNLSQINASSAVLVFSAHPNTGPDRNYTISYSGSFLNATVKGYPNTTNATLNSVEVYTATGYTPRSRFFVNANTNFSIQQNISIYMLPTASAEYAIINVVNRGEAVAGAYVSIMKFFSTTTTYTVTDERITNNQGQAATYIEPISYYKFAIHDAAGTLLYYSTGPEQFICDATSCSITIDVGNLVDFNMLTPYASANCYGNNSSNSIVFAYADGSGQTSSINFLAYREGVSAPVCNSTTTGASASYVCTLGAGENLTQYLYACEVWRSASPSLLAFVSLIDFRLYVAIVDWVMPALVLVTTLGVSAAYLPLGVGLGSVGLFVMSIMGIIAIPVSTSMPIMIVGLVIAFLLSKRGAD